MSVIKRLTRGKPPKMGLDTLTEILSNERRRLVIEALRRREKRSLSELAEYVARKEIGHEPNGTERERVYIALHQNHLPKLDDADAVEYDIDRKVIHRGDDYTGVNRMLEVLQSEMQ